MAIDLATFDEIVAARGHYLNRAVTCVILGDCTFFTPWRSGDNARDLREFGSRGGFESVQTIDATGNPSIRADLQVELPRSLHGQFDMVIDAGTLYCCFDVASVWRNILSLLRPDGTIVNLASLTGHLGRGYYDLQPMLFRDFYQQNGFKITALKVRIRKHFESRSLLRRVMLRLVKPDCNYVAIGVNDMFLNDASWRRLTFGQKPAPEAAMLPNDAEILCIARRVEHRPFTNAMPSFYS